VASSLEKLRRLNRLLNPRVARLWWDHAVRAARDALHDYERTLEVGVDPHTALVASRDRITAPSLKGIVLGESTVFGPQSRILVHADGPGDPLGAIQTGRGVRVGANAHLEVFSHQKITIGDHSSLGDNCALAGNVTIGRHCLLAWNLLLSTGDHRFADRAAWPREQHAIVGQDPRSSEKENGGIIIDDDVWVGWGAFIKRGVHLGRGAVIGAYTVVTQDVPPYSMQGGMPNREVGRRLQFSPPALIDASRVEHRPYLYSGFRHSQADLPPSGLGLIADGPSLVIAKGGRFERLVIRGRSTDAPVALRVAVNGAAAGQMVVGPESSAQTLAVPADTERPRSGLFADHNVITLDPIDDAAGRQATSPLFELMSVALE
jgi:acetyltransferase-like isoleucine patch superfamily enzyme